MSWGPLLAAAGIDTGSRNQQDNKENCGQPVPAGSSRGLQKHRCAGLIYNEGAWPLRRGESQRFFLREKERQETSGYFVAKEKDGHLPQTIHLLSLNPETQGRLPPSLPNSPRMCLVRLTPRRLHFMVQWFQACCVHSLALPTLSASPDPKSAQ